MKRVITVYLLGMVFIMLGFSQTQEGGGTWYETESKGLNASHLNLPFGTRVRVTNLQNERQVIVTIDNRISESPDRIIDISKAAADNLEMSPQGATPVRIEVLARRRSSEPEPTPEPVPVPTPPVQVATPEPVIETPPPPPPTPEPVAPPPPVSSGTASGMVSQTTINIYGYSPSYTPDGGIGSVQPAPSVTAPTPSVVAPRPAVIAPRPAVIAPRPAVIAPRPAVIAPRPAVISPAPAVISPAPATVAPSPQVSQPNPSIRVVSPVRVEPSVVTPTTVEPIRVTPMIVSPTIVGTTTVGPTTISPTTVGPTTVSPTNVSPTSVGPTTVGPTSVEAAPSGPVGAQVPSVSGSKFRLQVGAFTEEVSARDMAIRLRNVGLSPAYEISGSYYRVVIAGVSATELDTITRRINSAGFTDILIRTEQ